MPHHGPCIPFISRACDFDGGRACRAPSEVNVGGRDLAHSLGSAGAVNPYVWSDQPHRERGRAPDRYGSAGRMSSRLASRAVARGARGFLDPLVLPCAIALALVSFGLDLRFDIQTLSGAGYVLALLIALRSARVRDALLTAALTLGLILLAPLHASRGPERARELLQHLPLALTV